MKMRGRKVLGFFITIGIFTFFYIITLFTLKELFEVVAVPIVYAILGSYGFMIGLNSVDKYTISKNFVKSLVDKKEGEDE